jgi:hypothetical protein
MFLLLLLFVSCGDDKQEDRCQDVTCQTPPADSCKDANTLLVYETTGTCNPDTGGCEYSSSEQACENGCSQGECQTDLCQGVTCDQPPPNECKDANTLIVYDTTGTCNPDTGECEYTSNEHACQNGCSQGACEGDPCQNVVCDQPPPDECKDSATLLEYPATGTCDPATGLCDYPATEVPCDQYCSNGVCDEDLGDDFALRAPAGTRLCSIFGGPDPFYNYDSKGILYFKEGVWRLPRDQASFESDLVDRVEISPGMDIQPTGPGVFTRTIQGTADDGQYVYEYRRPYDNGGDPFELIIRATFQVTAGQAEAPVLLIDDAEYLAAHFCNTTVSAWGNSLSWGNGFLTCQFDARDVFERWRVEVTTESGDQLTMHLRLSYKCCCLIGRDWAEIVETRLVRGQDERIQTGFYRQAFSAQHHFFGRNLLAMFDTPLSNVHGVLLSDADGANPVLEYLDADFNVVETPTITSLEEIQE